MIKSLPILLAALAACPAFAGELELPASINDLRANAPAVDAPPPTASETTRDIADDHDPSDPSHDPNFRITPARRNELIGRSGEWRVRREDMRVALNEFYDGVVAAQGHDAEWRKLVLEIWALANQVETVQATVAERMSARVPESDPDRERRLAAIATVREFRRFVIYGNLIPRVIDEGSQDSRGLSNGRIYAGPTWGIAMTSDEGYAVDHYLIEATGFTRADYKALDKAVNAEYKAAHPGAK
jgi:hypothetical protein